MINAARPLYHPAHKAVNKPVVAGCFALCLLGLSVTALAPRQGESVAVLTSPFAAANTSSLVVARSGGLFEDLALSGHIMLARSSDPNFIDRLYDNGALLVFNPRILAACRQNIS